MSGKYHEKCSLVHSPFNVHSDVEHGNEWEGVRLLHQLGSGADGSSKGSYITHDVKVFGALRADLDRKQVVGESRKLLQIKELGGGQETEDSLIDSLVPHIQRSCSGSIYKPQESISLSEVVRNYMKEGEYVGSVSKRSSSQKFQRGPANTGRSMNFGNSFEKSPSVQSPLLGVVALGDGNYEEGINLGSSSERLPSAKLPLSNINTAEIKSSGRTGYSSHIERLSLVQPGDREIAIRGEEDSVRNINVCSEGPSLVKSPSSIADNVVVPGCAKHSYVSGEVLAQSQSEIYLVGEEAVGRKSYLHNSSKYRQSSLQSLSGEIETHELERGGRTKHTLNGSTRWSASDVDTHGDHGGRTSNISSGYESQLSKNYSCLDIKTLGEELGAGNCSAHTSSERQSLTKSNLYNGGIQTEKVDEEGSLLSSAVKLALLKERSLDELRQDPSKEVRRESANTGGKLLLPSPVLGNYVNGGEGGGKINYAGSRNEGLPSTQIDLVQSNSLIEMQRAPGTSCRQLSYLFSTSDLERDPESLSERVRGRGSVNQGNRQTSNVVSPTCEAESEVETRSGDEYEELDPTDGRQISLHRRNSLAAQVGERVPPEWALLLLGCLLGLATGLSVVLFNKGVHFVHDMAWAGTPKDGAAWFRLQQLIDIWHRVMLIPVVGGVVVGMMHAVLRILDQIKASRPPAQRQTVDWLAGVKPTIKAGQAMVTLGTGCSLGPEGPSVDIGKAWAHGLATIMKNSRERRIALVAAGAAAGISAGFNAPVSGMFFAIETVLRPQHAENSPPLTTAMIILASVISSTVSQVLLEETAAFTVPTYELRSAAELPLYLLLGGVCGVVSVIFTRMTLYFTEVFEFLRDRIGIPPTVTPAIGGLVTGLVALKYPGVLYWGFYNVDEILHSGKSATAPGATLVTQLICAKVVATAFSKGSGLVGGVYAPSLFIGAAVGSVYGTIAGKIINAALPGQDTVAHPQAYALVGMAALLAAVCSVPLTSVLLLFELTKDYHILLPLMGGIGVAIWVAAVAKQTTEKHFATTRTVSGRSFQPLGTDGGGVPHRSSCEQLVWRLSGNGTEVECCTIDENGGPDVVLDSELKDSIKVSQAMSKAFVKVQPIATVKETIGKILLKQQRCALVVDENDLLEGIFTFSDLESEVLRAAESLYNCNQTVLDVDKMLVAAFCSVKGSNQGQDTDLVVCFPDMSLRTVIDIMDSSGFKQLPVVAREGKRWQDGGRQIVGLIDRTSIPGCIREEASKRITAILAKNEDDDDDAPLLDAH